ncbi:hypothetical protein [Pseudoalteromonas sp. B160]|uniref:hypothetical protein n=1 Tax=Pseudoalteromonas sp. B160 TaxID=630414 RepID=UPI00301D84E6
MRIAHSSELENIKTAAGNLNDYADIQRQIELSQALLVEFQNCYCVLRLDDDGLCVVCAEGKNLLKMAPHIVRIARKLKTPSIVYHTKRKALARHLRAYNFNYEMTDTYGHLVYRMVL